MFKKLLKSLIIFVCVLEVLSGAILAAEITVVFKSDDDNVVSGSKLFNEVNWLPGFSVERTLVIRNDDLTSDCLLHVATTNETDDTVDPATLPTFATRLFVAIELEETNEVVYGNFVGPNEAGSSKSLRDLYDSGSVVFDLIAKNGGEHTYNWVVTFDSAAESEYQKASTTFDLLLTCVQPADGDDGPKDSTQRDRRPKNNHGGDSDASGAALGAATVFAPGIPPFVEELPAEVEGITTELPSTITEPSIWIAGAKDVCTDPWWWFLIFALQFILYFFVKGRINEHNFTKRDRFYATQLLLTLVFLYIFWRFFCPWWDIWVSGVLGILGIYLTYRKIKKLEDKLRH